MSFLKDQQRKAALRLLAWQYQRNGQPLPDRTALEKQAGRLVDDAHRIARERGGNVLSILKEMVTEIRRR